MTRVEVYPDADQAMSFSASKRSARRLAARTVSHHAIFVAGRPDRAEYCPKSPAIRRMSDRMKANRSLASNEEWKAWGKFDPLYGVATIPGHAKHGADPWTDESFYEIGAVDWNLFRAKWEQYGVKPGVCVEIGCGAGRLTAHLALYFQCVHGLDVSAGMIEYARPRMPANVSLHTTGGRDIPLPDGSAEAVFSTHVLQHLPDTNAAAAYFREMSRVLLPGGTIMLHVPLIVWPHGTFRGMHKLVHRLKSRVDFCRAQLGRYAFRLGFTDAPPMQVISYELTWLYLRLAESGFHDIEIRVLVGGSRMAAQHPFVFARKT
jgi:ubiquinone/menaquinone biosynthesis C-methylase UbiE